jgi:methionine biosynthesis protein MetW
MRGDLLELCKWISPKSRVLDLGCGDGDLIEYLINNKQVNSLGVEIDPDKITTCVSKGLNVIEQNIDDGLKNFEKDSFDTVLLTQTLQAVHNPDFVLNEMLRVGKEGIVSFPNFGHWQVRCYLFFKGKMPVSKMMPYEWFNTPNIHFCTIKDFEKLCKQNRIKILHASVQMSDKKTLASRLLNFLLRLSPNLFGSYAIYHVTK